MDAVPLGAITDPSDKTASGAMRTLVICGIMEKTADCGSIVTETLSLDRGLARSCCSSSSSSCSTV